MKSNHLKSDSVEECLVKRGENRYEVLLENTSNGLAMWGDPIHMTLEGVGGSGLKIQT